MTPDEWDLIYDMLDQLELLTKEAARGQGMLARRLEQPMEIMKKRASELRYGE